MNSNNWYFYLLQWLRVHKVSGQKDRLCPIKIRILTFLFSWFSFFSFTILYQIFARIHIPGRRGFFEIFINHRFQDSEKFSNFSRYFHGHRKMAPKRSQTYRSLRCDDRLLSDDDGSRCVHGQNCNNDGKVRPRIPKKKVPKDFTLPALF